MTVPAKVQFLPICTSPCEKRARKQAEAWGQPNLTSSCSSDSKGTILTLTVKWSSSTMLRPPLTRRSKSETFLNWSPASQKHRLRACKQSVPRALRHGQRLEAIGLPSLMTGVPENCLALFYYGVKTRHMSAFVPVSRGKRLRETNDLPWSTVRAP
jgi:hypothetical protein